MLFEQQISERRERGHSVIARILAKPQGQPFGDYTVRSSSGKSYRVAMRGPALFENFCSCPDFAVNTLGTCKHIEGLLERLRKRHGSALERRRQERLRASVSLHYGDRLQVRLRLPSSPSGALVVLAGEYFDGEGVLREEHFGAFDRVLDELRRLDDQAVVYSDVLEFLDRENEIAEGIELERKLLAAIRRGKDPTAGTLKTKLLPYQVRGAVFAACRGRVVLADDMGLGKTIQALAATELLEGRAARRLLARVRAFRHRVYGATSRAICHRVFKQTSSCGLWATSILEARSEVATVRAVRLGKPLRHEAREP